MWFTRVSLKNPVFATMVMLAIVVLGLFSYQRLRVDQFPNIDFPVVVVTAEYPGASPEIVESEVTKKLEEGVNSIAGINALTSRSYEGQSVVIIEFQLHMDGRKAAEDVREKVASIRPNFRAEVKEPRVLRFDPASRAIWSIAVLPDPARGKPMSDVELTNWADQVFKKRLENVRGVGSVALVGGTTSKPAGGSPARWRATMVWKADSRCRTKMRPSNNALVRRAVSSCSRSRLSRSGFSASSTARDS